VALKSRINAVKTLQELAAVSHKIDALNLYVLAVSGRPVITLVTLWFTYSGLFLSHCASRHHILLADIEPLTSGVGQRKLRHKNARPRTCNGIVTRFPFVMLEGGVSAREQA
jgi:hypothetical protein